MNYYNQIEPFEYVSFDLFDTLVFRTFSEYFHVFRYVQFLYNEKYDEKIQQFTKKRENAEKIARKKRNWEEVSLDEIYEELSYPDEVKTRLKTLEIYVEEKNCIPNKEMTDLFRYCQRQGKTMMVITDMYLPEKCIRKILGKSDIICENLFISGEIKKTKITGELFGYVLGKLNISPDKMVHIGDNRSSDYSNPLKLGIHAVCYSRKKEKFPYQIKGKNNILVNHVNSIIKNGYCESDRYRAEYKLGYTVMGPIVSEFCLWIHKIKMEENIDHLLFLSREGYAIKKCYEEMFPEEISSIHYARLNKHVLRLPLLEEDNIKEIMLRSIKNHREVSWEEVLKHFSMNDFLIQEFMKKWQINRKEKINLEDIEKSEYIYIFRDLVELLKPLIDEQKCLMKEYINSFEITGARVGLVNNSYSGNGQALLEKFCFNNSMNIQLIGLQFAGNKKCQSSLGKRYRTWISSSSDKSLRSYLFERGSLVFEHLLFEPNGTSLKLIRNDEGMAAVVCEEPRGERKDFERIKTVQDGIADFVLVKKNNIQADIGEESIQYFINLIQKPERQDAIVLGSLYDDDVDGDRHIIDFEMPFHFSYLYKNDIYNKISWIQGYLRGRDEVDLYRIIFNVRLWMTDFIHKIKRV